MAETNESLLELANASGFLFQLRVEREIAEKSSDHGWEVAAREHYWKDVKTDNDGYIDLVLNRGTVHMAIECKRLLNASWLFLIPDEPSSDVNRARLLWTNQIPEHPSLSGWDEFAVNPTSSEAAFCVVRGQNSKDKPLLEKLCGTVLQALEGLASEGLGLKPNQANETNRVYIPVILTTAKLVTCRFDSSDVDIISGQLALDQCKFESVPFLRFRKGLVTTRISKKKPLIDFKEANREKERTVFVVQAGALSDFLKHWELCFSRQWPWSVARAQETSELGDSTPAAGKARYF